MVVFRNIFVVNSGVERDVSNVKYPKSKVHRGRCKIVRAVQFVVDYFIVLFILVLN